MAILVAHRGFRSPAGENRMVDFENALKVCPAVEFDIRLTKDNQIIIFHDDTFNRIGGVDVKVNNLTYEEIKNLPFFKENPISVPPLLLTFIEQLSSRYQIINVEIKEEPDRLYTEAELELIFNGIKKLGQTTTAEIIVSSFDANLLNEIKKQIVAPMKKGYLFEEQKDYQESYATAFDYIHPCNETAYEPEIITKLKKLNKPLNIWTFKTNEEAEKIKQIYGDQVYSYISDNPELKWN